jgi:hypothetical protein
VQCDGVGWFCFGGLVAFGVAGFQVLAFDSLTPSRPTYPRALPPRTSPRPHFLGECVLRFLCDGKAGWAVLWPVVQTVDIGVACSAIAFRSPDEVYEATFVCVYRARLSRLATGDHFRRSHPGFELLS